MSGQGINQKDYLKKYLSGNGGDKKKKKRKPKTVKAALTRLRIVDDDVGVQDIRPLDEGELDVNDLQEDAPQIAGIIDERPEDVKLKDKFLTKKWKVVADESDNGFKIIDNTCIEGSCVEEIKSDVLPVRIIQKKESDGLLMELSEKEFSPSWRDSVSSISCAVKQNSESNSDISHSMKAKHSSSQRHENGERDFGLHRERGISDVEMSTCGNRKDIDSDSSPPRKLKHTNEVSSRSVNQGSDSDVSPPRKSKKRVSDGGYTDKYFSPKNNKESRENLPRKQRRVSDSDMSSTKKGKESSMGNSKRKYDSDESPPRHDKHHNRHRPLESSLQRKYKRESKYYEGKQGCDDEVSFLCRENKRSLELSQKSSQGSDSGQMSSRWEHTKESKHRRKDAERQRPTSTELQVCGSDLKDQAGEGTTLSADSRDTRDASSVGNEDLLKSCGRKITLDGRKEGLVEASELKAEIEDIRHKERKLFENMNSSVSGRGAVAVVRDRQTGKRRDMEQEANKNREKDEKEAERDAKYSQWGKGLKQVTDLNQKLQEDLYEMSKPLARYADDADLDKYLRDQERDGDPMLLYIRSKSKTGETEGKLQYEGSFLPNRYGIRPGYRWDGVDRSNGYEKQWFEQQNAKKAIEEDAYKWSTADM